MIRRAAAFAAIVVLLALAVVLVREVWAHAARNHERATRMETVQLALEKISPSQA